MRLSREGPAPVIQQLPLVIYSNHASWWDPLVAIFLRDKFFPHRAAYAPMDSNMLRRYGFFRRLGFFGVEPATRRGAAQFLSTSAAVLSSPLNILAITPQARFVDVRERPLRFSSGIGHLAASVQRACFVPLAIEYTFWEERLPEILVRFGSPLEPGRCGLGPKKPQEWTNLFEEQLQQTQEALSTEACRRSPDDFLTLLHGAVGQSPVYDLWRRLKSCWSGEPFKKEHGLK